MSESTGKVWLVGAGPGDAGLFTRKGYDVLQTADVVVYDALVGDGVLACVPRSARTIDVGKRAANHTMRQEQISHVMLDEALAGEVEAGDTVIFEMTDLTYMTSAGLRVLAACNAKVGEDGAVILRGVCNEIR